MSQQALSLHFEAVAQVLGAVDSQGTHFDSHIDVLLHAVGFCLELDSACHLRWQFRMFRTYLGNTINIKICS